MTGYRRYTLEEDRLIRSVSAEVILLAERIGRTPAAIRARRSWLRRQDLRPRPSVPRPVSPIVDRPGWFEEDLDVLVRR